MKRALLWLIRFYQRNVSGAHRPCCRYTPTCSQYALVAIERFGALRGGCMALWRLLRCNPFSRGGYDPVKNLDGTYGPAPTPNGEALNKSPASTPGA